LTDTRNWRRPLPSSLDVFLTPATKIQRNMYSNQHIDTLYMYPRCLWTSCLQPPSGARFDPLVSVVTWDAPALKRSRPHPARVLRLSLGSLSRPSLPTVRYDFSYALSYPQLLTTPCACSASSPLRRRLSVVGTGEQYARILDSRSTHRRNKHRMG
jgi:hypothetical protein